jgi:hypothetical protein
MYRVPGPLYYNDARIPKPILLLGITADVGILIAVSVRNKPDTKLCMPAPRPMNVMFESADIEIPPPNRRPCVTEPFVLGAERTTAGGRVQGCRSVFT